MNKIIVNMGEVNYNGDLGVLIDDKTITFNESGSYFIEYDDIDEVELVFNIKNADVIIYEDIFDTKLKVNNVYNVYGGKLKINKFYCNLQVLEKISINLFLENDLVDYNFASISSNCESYQIDVFHRGKKTVSNIKNRAVALDGSKIHFTINSTVYKEGCKAVLDQNTRIVTFGDCETEVKPNMYIDLEDVLAKHGSVIGTFKDEQIFYLMSKGISYNETLKLLVKGFLLSDRVISVDTRKRITDIIDMYWR